MSLHFQELGEGKIDKRNPKTNRFTPPGFEPGGDNTLNVSSRCVEDRPFPSAKGSANPRPRSLPLDRKSPCLQYRRSDGWRSTRAWRLQWKVARIPHHRSKGLAEDVGDFEGSIPNHQ